MSGFWGYLIAEFGRRSKLGCLGSGALGLGGQSLGVWVLGLKPISGLSATLVMRL